MENGGLFFDVFRGKHPERFKTTLVVNIYTFSPCFLHRTRHDRTDCTACSLHWTESLRLRLIDVNGPKIIDVFFFLDYLNIIFF